MATKGIFEALEKLVTEHASAAVMKERIDWIKERYGHLADENTELKAKVKSLEEDIKTLTSSLHEAASKKSANELTPDEEIVLKFYVERNGRWHSSPEVSHFTGLKSVRCDYAIDRLCDLKFIQTPGVIFDNSPIKLTLAHEGRGYAIQRGWI